MFARKLMRPFGLALLLLALLFIVGTAALAEEDPVNFTIQVSPESLTAPGEVTVTIRVSNPTDTDMVYPVSLLDPDGNLVTSFGNGGEYALKSGETMSPWEGKWNVTQEQLDAGSFSYTLRYHQEDETGAMVEFKQQATARVSYVGERVNLTITRTITPEVVRDGGTATVTYELYNSGNVDLTNVRVQENISRNAQKVNSLPAGERATLTFTSRIGTGLVSNATVTYNAAGSTQTLTEKVEDAEIPLAKPNLKIELSTPQSGVNVNEAATLLITFINEGNITYSNVTVTEAKKGEILTNITIPAGQTVTETKEFILTEPTTFKVTANLPDNTGETKTMTSNELAIGVYDPDKTLLLSLTFTSDVDGLYSLPMDTRFHLVVTNNSNVKAEKVKITHGDTEIYTIETLEPGASVTLDRDVTIRYAGKFQFTATTKDTMNNTVSFTSNAIQLNRVSTTPVPTKAPTVTVAPPELVTPVPNDQILEKGRNAMLTAAVAIGALLGLALILFIVSTVIRLYNKSKSNAAFDHLDLAERRDYTEPADEDFDDADDSDEYPEDEPVDSMEDLKADVERVLPHERLLNNEEAEQHEEPKEDAPAPIEEEGGYRISRDGAGPVLTNAPAISDASADDGAASEAVKTAEHTVRRRRSQRAQRTEDGE